MLESVCRMHSDDTFTPTRVPTAKPTNSPTPWPTFPPTLQPTHPPTVAPTHSAECKVLAKTAKTMCASMAGHGIECVHRCEKKIEKWAARNTFGAVRKCPTEWRKSVRREICWPSDCHATMEYYCGAFKDKVVRGLNAQSGDYVHVSACDICVNHYVYADPPILRFGCWHTHSSHGYSSHRFCPLDSADGWYQYGSKSGKPLKLNHRPMLQHGNEVKKTNIPKFLAYH